MRLSEVESFGIGKVLIGVIIVLVVAITALGFHDLSVSGERNVLEQTVKTEKAETARQKDRVAFYKAWMERDRLDAKEKDEEFDRKMAEKPKYITSIKYVPTGEKCTDLSAIAEEARKNAEGGKL
ncbi:hypothetical protein [Sulfuricurvum sp.]|uniref:hypothetical protein n=1 Tax=Sulfuricurvum sp. TaxID=2025608 RepID=UPI002E30BD1B|nr:hypothetical protein [Sulfuricurvum sp.]HEX5330997.1 hypothetical protein [Sulfuricurvum sp.]